MSNNKLHSINDLFGSFLARNVQIAESINKRVILWDEAFEQSTRGKLPSTAIIQIWRDWAGMRLGAQAAAAGHAVIASPNGRWYLDHIDATWQDMYKTDPVAYLHIPQEHASQVLGGEGCMWGETVDPGDLEATIWPRLAAIAERLWSPLEVTSSWQAALPRLESFRCLLLERGVGASTVGGRLAERDRRFAPKGPSSCGGEAPPSFLQIASRKAKGIWENLESSLAAVVSGDGSVAGSTLPAGVQCSCAKMPA